MGAHNKWISYWKLLADLNGWRSGSLVDFEAANSVGQEVSAELASLEDFRCLCPVLKIPLGG